MQCIIMSCIGGTPAKRTKSFIKPPYLIKPYKIIEKNNKRQINSSIF